MIESRPSLLAHIFDSIRYRIKLALFVLLAGSAFLYIGGTMLNQGFESSVVLTYPLPPRDPQLPVPPNHNAAVVAALQQSSAVQEAFQEIDEQAPLVSRLGARAYASFFRIHLELDPLPTSLHNSIPITINAKESSPDGAQALARAVGLAVTRQAGLQLPIASASPISSDTSAHSALILGTPAPIAAFIAPQLVPQAAPRQPSKIPPFSSAAMQQRKELTDDLIAAQDRQSVLAAEMSKLDALERTQSVPPPPVRSFATATLRTQVSDSHAILADLEKRYTEQHPDVVAEKDRLHDLEAKLAQAVAHDDALIKAQILAQQNQPAFKARVARQAEIRPELESLNARIANDTAQINQLSATVSAENNTRRQVVAKLEAQAAAHDTPQQAQERAAQSDQVHQLTARVQAYLQSGDNAKSKSPVPQSSTGQPPVVQPPVATGIPPVVPAAVAIAPPPSAPSFPSPTSFVSTQFVATTSILLALLASILSIVLAELLSRTIKNSRSLENELPTGVEFLGEIPRMSH